MKFEGFLTDSGNIKNSTQMRINNKYIGLIFNVGAQSISRQLIIFFALFLVFTYAYPNNQKLDKASCLNLTSNDKSYLLSADRVMALKSVKKWSRELELNNKRVAIGSNVDKTVFKNSSCFWSITFYESNESKLQLWREYLVEVNVFGIFLVNQSRD